MSPTTCSASLMYRVAAITLGLALFFTLPAPLAAQETVSSEQRVTGIIVRGNQRIETSTIMSYLGIGEQRPFSSDEIDQSLKNLYGTGFFADVKIFRQGTELVVEVVENPVINRVAFEGNVKIEDKDLENEIEMKPRSIYTRNKVQSDVKRILDIYRRQGRFSATVEPKVIPLEQNRVNLVFEIEEGEVSKIRKISFIGNQAFDSDTLEDVVRSQVGNWYNFLTSDDTYDPDRLLYDQELLRRFYNANGYADFQVKSAVAELTPEKDGFYITFSVDEGKVYNFGTVEVKTTLKGADTLASEDIIQTKSGEVYNATQVEDTIDAMVKELGDRGFAFVDIDPELKRHPETQTIDLAYRITEGPRVYVDRINIHGNVRTLDEVIRREFRLAEGDPYSTSKLARTEQRLRNLGFFETVNIQNLPGTAPDKSILDVEVQERSTGEITLGAGFSTTDGPLADVGIRESNFLGRGQDLRFRVLFAAERQQYDIGFTEPYFLDRELAAGFDLFRTEQDFRDESSFDREANGFNLRLGYAISEHLQHSLTYSFRETEITDISADASRFIRDQEGKVSNSSIGHAFTYEDRDNRFNPNEGMYYRFAQEFAGIGGDTQYLRHEVRGAYYYPVAKDWVVQLLGAGGHIFGINEDVRINDRFFLGGQDLRGFESAGVGPRDITSDDALGGNIYYTGSVELRFPLGLPEEYGFQGAIFTDAGSLWEVDDSGPEVVDKDSVRVSLGFGIAWSSPFGPLRVDISHPVVKEDFDVTETFRFSFGTRF